MAKKIFSERLVDVFQEEILTSFRGMTSFKRFARSISGLCLDEHEIDDIIEDHRESAEEQKMQMLMKWQENLGSAATVSKIRALVRGFTTGDPDEDYVKLDRVYGVFRDRPLCKRRHVYHGEQRSDVTGSRPVAIKFLDFNKRNLREAKVLLKLASHPNVVSILHSDVYHEGEFSQKIFIAMELCHEENLTNFLENRAKMNVPFDNEQGILMAYQLLDGLSFIHQNDVVHRDLKPDNILTSLDQQSVKISDFGISKDLQRASTTTQTSTRAGSDGYRAPETYLRNEITMKSDVYSMAVVIYALWSNGKHPFGDDADAWNYFIKKNMNRNFNDLLICNKAKAINLLGKMMQFTPENRPTAAEILSHSLLRKSHGQSVPEARGEGEVFENQQTTFGRAKKETKIFLPSKNADPAKPVDEHLSVESTKNPISVRQPVTSSTVQEKKTRQLTNIKSRPKSSLPDDALIIFDKNSGHLQNFNPRTNEWKRMQKINPNMQQCRFSAVALNPHIYVLDSDNLFRRLRYDDKKATWEELESPIEKHGWNISMVLVQEPTSVNIWVVGGSLAFDTTTSVEKYDTVTEQWVKMTSKNLECQHNAAVCMQETIYSFGGSDVSNVINKVECFDLQSSTWGFVSPMLKARAHAAAVEFHDQLYVLGGYDGKQVLRSVETYNPSTNSWTMLAKMRKEREVLQSFVIGGHIYAVGGDRHGSRLTFEKYTDRGFWNIIDSPEKMNIRNYQSVKVKAI